MKKLLFILLLPSIAYAEGPIFHHALTDTQQEFENVYRDLRDAKTPLNVTVSSVTTLQGPVFIGLSSPTATASATTGGTLAGTYYFKVYPFTSNGMVGFPSNELVIVVGGGNSAVSLSWTAVTGAAYYRVSRGTSQGSSSGYYQTTATSYLDTGAAFTSGASAIVAPYNEWLKVSGTIFLPCGGGSINYYDYTDGIVHAHTACTSAGEYEMSTGSGVAQGHFLFEDAGFNQRLLLDVSATPANFIFSDSGSWLTGKISATNLTIVGGSNPNRVDSLFISSITNTSFVPLNAKGSSDGSSATAGYFGETASASILRSGAHVMGNNVTTSIATMTLTAGDWDLDFACGYLLGASGATSITCALSQTANTAPAANTTAVANSSGEFEIRQPFSISANDDYAVSSMRYPVKISATTTFYLVSQIAFAGGTCSSYGSVQARRAAH